MDLRIVDWKNMTTEEFIRLSRLEHGDEYDYSHVVYVSKSKKVDIVCPKHGVFHQSPTYHLEGHGCNHKECVQAKRERTMLTRHGAVNPMQTDVGRHNFEKTCLDRYGTTSVLSSGEVREKIHDTMVARYGGNGAMCSERVREKSKATMLEKYGVDNAMRNSNVKARQQASLVDSHGVSNPMFDKDVVRKQLALRCNTAMGRYGIPECLASREVRAKIAQTNLERYGFENVMKNPDIVQKNFDVRRANGTLSASAPEEWLYSRLCDYFGAGDVVRQYSDSRYPFACDFYVVSRDMFIELNGSWTHGKHWFDSRSLSDNDVAGLILGKSETQPFYKAAYEVWTVRDASKRRYACSNHLNYVVFWDGVLDKVDGCLRDAELWFACGCPDAHDWEREYSWIPERKFDMPELPKLTRTSANLSRVAKFAHYREFYRREIDLWNRNPMRNGVSLQIWLYYNRYKYINKTPLSLSDFELLRGFTISGLLHGYTVFDVELFDVVVKKYDIDLVYDPCAGWGERMLYCYENGIEYHGVDINRNLAPGYSAMVDKFGIIDQIVTFGDSAVTGVPALFDAVITCPPYGSIEVYSDVGAENMDYDDFLAWWQQVVYNSVLMGPVERPEYFCFQVNQAWKQSMGQCVENAGYELIDELVYSNNRVSHMHRKNASVTKKEYESMLVFRKKDI